MPPSRVSRVHPEALTCDYPNQHIVHRGWRILIPHGDTVDVITPINILFRAGWGILMPHEDKVGVFTPVNILFRGVANVNVMMVMM